MRTPGLVFALALDASIMLASCASLRTPGPEDSAVEEPSEVEEVTDHSGASDAPSVCSF